MKGYVEKALKEYLWSKRKDTFGPTKYAAPEYGKKIQYATEDTSNKLDEKGKQDIQQKTGKFLYYGRAIDNTMLHALNKLNIAAANVSEETKKDLEHFLDYCATNPNAQIIYRASDMQLTIYSDAGYLNAAKSISRVGGYHFLGNKDGTLFNGAIHILAKVIKAVMASAAEAEVGSLFLNAQDAIPLIITLEELRHKQEAILLKTDNSTADEILNKTIKQKRSKAFDMRFHWLCDRVEQEQCRVFWAPGKLLLGDYFTKSYPESHHKNMRYIYL